jgi:competence protein ComEA
MESNRDRIRAVGWIAAVVLVAVLAVRALSGGGGEAASVAVDPAPGPAVGAGGPGGPGSAPPGGSGGVLVQVAGEVRRPGVYTVPAGARVHEAVERAGGLTRRADQAGVNLVAKVADGQQVVVPRRGATAGAAGGGSAGTAVPGGAGGAAGPKVSLGSATPEQLDGIDGIGPTLAQRIVEYRQKNGGFSSVDELRQVDGIGEKRFESLREAVTP